MYEKLGLYIKYANARFPKQEAATKLFYFKIRNFEKIGRCVRGRILNDFGGISKLR